MTKKKKKNYASLAYGFTLIEVLVVFSIIGMLTALGIASYSAYNSTQTLQSAATTVATVLESAKSRSIAQKIPTGCTTFSGYQVDITVGGQQYTLSALCNGTKQTVSTALLSPQVSFSSGSTTPVFFAGYTGLVSSTATITLAGYGKTKTISVSPTGLVRVQ